MAQLLGYDGFSKKKIQIGVSDDSPTIEATDDGRLQIGQGLLVPRAAVKDDDVVNLKTLLDRVNGVHSDAISQVYQLVYQLFGDGTIPEGTSITLGNVMLGAYTLSTLVDDSSYSIGILGVSKYIDRIIVEIIDVFTKADETEYEIAIGTPSDAEAFMSYRQITNIDKTFSCDVCKTLDRDTEFILSVREIKEEEPPEDSEIELEGFIQRVENEHDRVNYEIRTDASGRVVSISIGASQLGSEDVNHTEIFGDIQGAGLLDFAINMPLKNGRQYRIVEINPLLEMYADEDETISWTDGTWVRDKIYTCDTDDFLMWFLLGHSTGASDYIHFVIYSIDTGEAIYSYHIKNEILLAQQSESVVAEFPIDDEINTSTKDASIMAALTNDGSIILTEAAPDDMNLETSQMFKVSTMSARAAGDTGKALIRILSF